MSWIALTAAIVSTFSAQLLLKFAAVNKDPTLSSRKLGLFALSLACYGMGYLFYYYAMKHLNLSLVAPVGTITVTLLLFMAGTIVFRESFSTQSIVGVFLGVLSIYFLVKGSA